MKKIFSFLSLLLMAFAVQAQEVWVLNTEDEGGEPVVPGAYDAEEVTTWFSSPFTDPGEGSIAGLFDDDQSTFWHSNWHNGNASNGVHYLRVDLPEGFWDDNADFFPFVGQDFHTDKIIEEESPFRRADIRIDILAEEGLDRIDGVITL